MIKAREQDTKRVISTAAVTHRWELNRRTTGRLCTVNLV